MEDIGKWADPTFEPSLRVAMVDPHKRTKIRGDLLGVTKVTLTDGYYSDTKISGSIETIDDNYIFGAWLWVIVEGKGVAMLGVESVQRKQSPEGSVEKTYTCQSVLWMLDSDIMFWMYTIGKNTKASEAIKTICSQSGKDVVFQPGWKDKIFSSSKTYERTESVRSILSDLCTTSGDQLGVDGDGRITVEPYIDPGNRTVSWTLDVNGERSIVLSPGYEDTDATGDAYNRSVIVAENGGKTIIADHRAPASLPISFASLGWMRTAVHQISDMNPFTQKTADQLVLNYLPDDRSAGKTRTCTCMYIPVKGGEIVQWAQGEDKKKYMIQTADFDLNAWTVKLTLKEI